MTDSDVLAELRRIRELQERIALFTATEHCQILIQAATYNRQQGNISTAINILEQIIESREPLFTATALLTLLDIYQRLGLSKEEKETSKRILDLPELTKGLVPPAAMGVVYQRAGDLEKAKQTYIRGVRLGGPSAAGIEQNLAELLLIKGDLSDALPLAERSIARPEAGHQIIGHYLKAMALWKSGNVQGSIDEFRWIGQYLTSLGAVPADFNWSFDDAAHLLSEVALPEARLVLKVLKQEIDFPTFKSKWQELTQAAPTV